ncbi:hypothetical protein EMPS_01564 [Entomortierella parvispora]|uniref:Uncharacterized protein n=1 Tax=Entomortierella parvispora TaxID=205924 RepID=A0A9P3LSQ2_9FUNG|nr:hypothetical protein EMPS_01564 [Entomortierella parvispora]
MPPKKVTPSGPTLTEGGSADVSKKSRLSDIQRSVLVSFIEIPDNYKLLYDHGSTKGVTNAFAYKKMADFFLKQMQKNPQHVGNLDLNAVDAAFVESRFGLIMAGYTRQSNKKTGNGVHGGSKILKQSPFKDRLDALFLRNPKYDPIEIRDIGSLEDDSADLGESHPAVSSLVTKRPLSDTSTATAIKKLRPPFVNPALPEHLIRDRNDLREDEDLSEYGDYEEESPSERVPKSKLSAYLEDAIVLEDEEPTSSAAWPDPKKLVEEMWRDGQLDADMSAAVTELDRTGSFSDLTATLLLDKIYGPTGVPLAGEVELTKIDAVFNLVKEDTPENESLSSSSFGPATTKKGPSSSACSSKRILSSSSRQIKGKDDPPRTPLPAALPRHGSNADETMVTTSQKSQTSVQAAANTMMLERKAQNREFLDMHQQELQLKREEMKMTREKIESENALRKGDQDNMAMLLRMVMNSNERISSVLENMLSKKKEE